MKFGRGIVNQLCTQNNLLKMRNDMKKHGFRKIFIAAVNTAECDGGVTAMRGRSGRPWCGRDSAAPASPGRPVTGRGPALQ